MANFIESNYLIQQVFLPDDFIRKITIKVYKKRCFFLFFIFL